MRSAIVLSLWSILVAAIHVQAEAVDVGLAVTRQHARLAEEVGKWRLDITYWPGPGAQPLKSEATETVTAVGDYWTSSRIVGMLGGKKFIGHGLWGFDPEQQQFIGTWVDSTSPLAVSFVGRIDKKRRLVMTGSTAGRHSNALNISKTVTQLRDDGCKVLEVYSPVADNEEQTWLTIRIVGKRVK